MDSRVGRQGVYLRPLGPNGRQADQPYELAIRPPEAPVFSNHAPIPNFVHTASELRLGQPQNPKPRQKRASKPKVRTGCITCKIRHVKCDEGKPACYRCTSTGRKCDGYDVPQRVSQPMPGEIPGTEKERQLFYRFVNLTAPALVGGSESEFWNSFVLRAARQEPIIQNAVIALGALHEDYQARGGRYSDDIISDPSHQRALWYYGRALGPVITRLGSNQERNDKVVIIASILFACFEVLRRNDMQAIGHYKAGMRALLKQMGIQSQVSAPVICKDLSRNRAIPQPIPQDEVELLLRVFARYDLQTATFAQFPSIGFPTEIPESPPKMLKLKDLRNHIDNLLIAAYQLISADSQEMYRYWPRTKVPTDWASQITQQLQTFREWSSAIEDFSSTYEQNLDPKDQKSLLGLRLQLKVAMIRLETSIASGPESTFDRYESDFERMVQQVEHVTQAMGLTDVVPLDKESMPFTMELGIIHPLYFIATRCRRHRIRWRAISQLRKAGKEGVFEGPILAVVAKKAMQIEEEGLIDGQRPPEMNRIHKIQKIVDYDTRTVTMEMKFALDNTFTKFEFVPDIVHF